MTFFEMCFLILIIYLSIGTLCVYRVWNKEEFWQKVNEEAFPIEILEIALPIAFTLVVPLWLPLKIMKLFRRR